MAARAPARLCSRSRLPLLTRGPAPLPPEAHRIRRPLEVACVVLLLLLFAWMADTGVREKSAAFDEVPHLAAGYSYWRIGDFRLHPENGMLPQRWAALPLALRGANFPDLDSDDWRGARLWKVSYDFFFGVGNDPKRMLPPARRMMLALAVALGGLVYAWSRSLFGAAGGLLSLALFTFSPTLLAHGPLVTSDVTFALFLLAALGASWRALHALTPTTLLGAGVLTGLLMLSKPSALLFAPMWLVLGALRLASREPLGLRWRGRSRSLDAPARKLLGIAGAGVFQAGVAALLVWGFHGFRYASGARAPMQFPWSWVGDVPAPVAACVAVARDLKLLPESYLYGILHVLSQAHGRVAFLNGELRGDGFWTFFPYAFLVKTPLATLALFVVAGLVGLVEAKRRRRLAGRAALARAARRVAPLLVLLGVYGAASLASSLNIGHRHILPLYPALFILAGAIGLRWEAWSWGRRAVPAVLLAALLFESGSIRPHYLAFVNRIAGGPSQGYRHLVDSSLDWGQDLPGLARWIARERERGESRPLYLSYFGMSSPAYYGIEALPLPHFLGIGIPLRKHLFPLAGGVYAISATMLQQVYAPEAYRGPWTHALQEELRRLERRVAAGDGRTDVLSRYVWLRFARLAAYLRRREPDAQIGYSINVYRLSDAEAEGALHEPLVERAARREGPDDDARATAPSP